MAMSISSSFRSTALEAQRSAAGQAQSMNRLSSGIQGKNPSDEAAANPPKAAGAAENKGTQTSNNGQTAGYIATGDEINEVLSQVSASNQQMQQAAQSALSSSEKSSKMVAMFASLMSDGTANTTTSTTVNGQGQTTGRLLNVQG